MMQSKSTVKRAQEFQDFSTEESDTKQPSRAPKGKKYLGGAAYPAYDRALVTQLRRDPRAAGLARAAGTGSLGAILGAVAARLISNRKEAIGAGAVIGGLVGAVPGYQSGRDEALSDYSRLLFLRRRMNVNDPGELEALLRHPQIAARGIKSGSAEKRAAVSPGVAALMRILAGSAVGGAAGYYVTPTLGGYQDVESARRASGVIDATLGGVLGGLAHRAGGLAPLIRNMPTKALVGAPTAFGVGEMIPIGMATLQRTQDAMKDMSAAGKGLAESGKGLAESAKVTSIPYNLERLAQSAPARGAGVGVAGAGLAALVSGMMRRKSEDEILKHRSRGAMVGADFLKFVLPAMLAGGVIGSLPKDTNTNN